MPAKNKGTLVAEGAYTLHQGQTPLGRETWRLEKLAHGGLVFDSDLEPQTSPSSTRHFDYEITQNWAPVLFSFRGEREGKLLLGEQRASGAQWLAHIEPHGETARDLAVDFGPQWQVTAASPLFLAVVLVRLNLQVGQSHAVDAVQIDLATFEPRVVKQTFSCTAEEKVEVPAGKFSAWHYTVRTEGTESENQFWADRHGIVLSFQSAGGGEMKLARYRRFESH